MYTCLYGGVNKHSNQVLYTIDGAPGDDPETPNAYVLSGFSADQVGKWFIANVVYLQF